MSLVPGAQFGPYEVLSALGAGGWGKSTAARDTRLKPNIAADEMRH
jgi:hypothetical protein